MPKKTVKTYQLKIQLEGSKPPIWRRILVDSSNTLAELHELIQDSMGWEDAHLHHFIHGRDFYSSPNPFDGELLEDSLDAGRYRIDQLLKKEKDALRYEYDFGDGWLHKITLEKILPTDPAQQLPWCVTGKRACPPEDCGGIWGYTDLLDVLSDPKHPEREERLEWLGDEMDDFDPAAFSAAEVNEMWHGDE
ncbi:MAG: plasmid pRiA4b ORF-3 family protein [Thiolinea sp.]